MDEHVHRWRFGYRSLENYNLTGISTPGFYCTHPDCGYDAEIWINLVEAERRLNALGQAEAERDALREDVVLFAGATRSYLVTQINDLKKKEREGGLGGAEQEDLKWAENHLGAIDKHYPEAKSSYENIYWYFDRRDEAPRQPERED